MNLLERDKPLQTLEQRLQDAQAGSGKVLLLAGEAGVGKSALVEAFAQGRQSNVRTLWGTCDALSTPRALGPVHELAARLPSTPDAVQPDAASRERLFRLLLQELSRPDRTSLVVLEDLHWADEATLDFVRYIARRIQRTRCLFVITYRDDELGAMHPVRAAVGELTGSHVSRLRLAPLSLEACGTLAQGTGRDAALIFGITGGNPFFVREVLASAGEAVPESVRDAIVARLRHCSASAREVAEFVSLAPGRMESWLITTALGASQEAIDECVDRGLLQRLPDEALAFRHELARQAVNSTLPQTRARTLHGKILSALAERGGDTAKLVHHAELAGDVEALLHHAPIAGHEASRVGSHREAAAHFNLALKYADSLTPAMRADLYENHAQECYYGNRLTESMESATRALALWRQLGDVPAQSRTLRIISRLHWHAGDNAAADEAVAQAVTALESAPLGPALGMAYSMRGQMAMVCGRHPEALDYSERAIAVARQFGDRATEAHALNNIGGSLFATDPQLAFERLEQSLKIALEENFQEHAGRAYSNLFTSCVMGHQLERAERLLAEGLTYCEEHEVHSHLNYIRAHSSRMELERGNWDEAARIASSLLQNPGTTAVQRIPTLVTLAQVRARRGDPGVEELLDQALELSLPTGEFQRIGRAYAARAEYAWYRGDAEGVMRESTLALEQSGGNKDPWIKGELLFWQSRVAPLSEPPQNITEPYRLMLAGEWRAAASTWKQYGMPYERALALALGPEEPLRAALTLLESLGAAPLAAIVRRRLRELGARDVPRGPNSATARNPAGLTSREMEVLTLLAEGRTNAQLARALHLSQKTVDHHVSAILEKLQARSRSEAVAAAFNLGIVRAKQRQG
jgi:DNA-binding CsgD family transcriptional regulator/tetratricopeptide (TPR) repeat protein